MDFWTWLEKTYGKDMVAHVQGLISQGYDITDTNAYDIWQNQIKAEPREKPVTMGAANQPPTPEQVLLNDPDTQANYTIYLADGGTLTLTDWIKAGRPKAEVKPPVNGAGNGGDTTGEIPPFPTAPPPEGYHWELNEFNQWIPAYGVSTPRATETPSGKEKPDFNKAGMTRWTPQGTLEKYTIGDGWGYWEEVPNSYDETRDIEWQKEQKLLKARESQNEAQWQRERAWYEQQAAAEASYRQQQMESEKQKTIASLAANPISWMEYNAYTGKTPQVQPWMLPLMPQQYGQANTGEAIKGWQPNQTSGQPMTSLPELVNPSMQYWARLNPASQAQYQSYQRTRTGATPDDTLFKLWSMAPPSGKNKGLSWVR